MRELRLKRIRSLSAGGAVGAVPPVTAVIKSETCVCAGCGRIKLFAGLPQNRNDLNIKCLKHINCYLSVAHKQKEQLILTLK